MNLRKAWRFVLRNWGFVGFWLTVFFAVSAYWYYGLSYFETQKHIAQMKASANTYVKLGDNLVLVGEMRAARDAYRVALDIDESNVQASRGLLRTAVFRPIQGEKYITPEVIDRTIDFLSSIQADENEAFIVSYYRGERLEEQGKYAEAKAWYQNAIKQNPDFVYGYVALAFVSILNGDGIDFGMRQLEQAQQRQVQRHAPDSALILNNLGFCYLAKREYEKALEMLKRSRQISPYLEGYVNLGNAYRQMMDEDNLAQAVLNHEQALDLLNSQDEDGSSGSIAINFLPETPDDANSPKCSAAFETADEKRSLVYYELALDYALQHNWIKADRSFGRAFQLDADQAYADFIQNKMASLRDSLGSKLDQPTQRWLDRHKARLSPFVPAVDERTGKRTCP